MLRCCRESCWWRSGDGWVGEAKSVMVAVRAEVVSSPRGRRIGEVGKVDKKSIARRWSALVGAPCADFAAAAAAAGSDTGRGFGFGSGARVDADYSDRDMLGPGFVRFALGRGGRDLRGCTSTMRKSYE